MSKLKEIKGYSGYYVTDKGDVISSKYKKDRYLKPQRASQSKKGYLQVRLFNKQYPKGRLHYIHRLVYEAFVGEITDGYEIDHIDADPSNNTLENLQLLTRRQNTVKYNKNAFGICYREHRDEIIKDWEVLGTQQKVADKWNCHPSTVWRIIHKKAYVYDSKLKRAVLRDYVYEDE